MPHDIMNPSSPSSSKSGGAARRTDGFQCVSTWVLPVSPTWRACPGIPYSRPYMGCIWGEPVSPGIWVGFARSGWAALSCPADIGVGMGCPVVDALIPAVVFVHSDISSNLKTVSGSADKRSPVGGDGGVSSPPCAGDSGGARCHLQPVACRRVLAVVRGRRVEGSATMGV